MATIKPPHVEQRYKTLRFIAGMYSLFAAIVLVFGLLIGIGQLLSGPAMLGVGMIVGTLSLTGTCLMIAEGIAMFLDIEENTRQAAVSAAQAASIPPPAKDLQRIAASLDATARLIEQLLAAQQQANQRLDALATGVDELRAQVGTGVSAAQAVAESSKVTATVLYRQGARHN